MKLSVRNCYNEIYNTIFTVQKALGRSDDYASRKATLEAVSGAWTLYIAKTMGVRIPLVPKG